MPTYKRIPIFVDDTDNDMDRDARMELIQKSIAQLIEQLDKRNPDHVDFETEIVLDNYSVILLRLTWDAPETDSEKSDEKVLRDIPGLIDKGDPERPTHPFDFGGFRHDDPNWHYPLGEGEDKYEVQVDDKAVHTYRDNKGPRLI